MRQPPSVIEIVNRQIWWVVLMTGAVPVLAAFVVGLFWDGGKHAKPAFFAAVATILPVLFLAALVESRAVGRAMVARWRDDPTIPEIAMGALRSYGMLFVVGEAASLYAPADGSSSTLLVLTPCITMLATLVFMDSDLRTQLKGWPDPDQPAPVTPPET